MRLPTAIATAAVAPPDVPASGDPQRAASKCPLADSELRSALPQRGADRSHRSRGATSVVTPSQGSRAIRVVHRADEDRARAIEDSMESCELDELIADWAVEVIDRSMASESDSDASEEIDRSVSDAQDRMSRRHGEEDELREQQDERRHPDPEGSAWEAMPADRAAAPRHRYARSAVPLVASVHGARRADADRGDDRAASPSSDVPAALMWALAAMVVAVAVALLAAWIHEPPATSSADETQATPEPSATRTDTRSR